MRDGNQAAGRNKLSALGPYSTLKGNPSPDCLALEYLPLVRRLSRRFSRSGEPLEDLVQVGSVGLLKALKKYDPAKGSNFIAFAVPVIVGEIKNYFRDHGWAVKVPRKVQRQKMAVEKAVERLGHQLGRWPTIQEIAQATELLDEEVYNTLEVEKFGKPLSLDAEYTGNGSEDVSHLLDFLGHEDVQYDQVLDRIDVANALGCLTQRERAIVYLKFYAGLSQTKIAERLGISQMSVSRLQRHALGKLKLGFPR